MRYISGIEVKYGEGMWPKAPDGRVLEINGLNDDINYSFGGGYVWLVPMYTENPDLALTGFDIAIQKDPETPLKDLAEGTGGDYRYLITTKTVAPPGRVIDVGLLRLDDEIVELPAGWDAKTGNINKGRGKTFLYLLWKTA